MHHIVTEPSVILISKPQLIAEGVHLFADEQSLSDIPKLHFDTPLGRMFDHMDTPPDEKEHSDGEVLVEFAGRQCYGSWQAGRETPDYIDNILSTGHGSVLAHAHYSFVITGISRALSHELVRHAVGVDISQESQRFVDAKNVSFVAPPALLKVWNGDTDCEAAQRWYDARLAEIEDYIDVQNQVAFYAASTGLGATLARKRANEAARYSLPNAAETKGVWTFNFRALRHILNLRGDLHADLEIRRLAAMIARLMRIECPSTFHDVEVVNGDFDVPAVNVKYEKP